MGLERIARTKEASVRLDSTTIDIPALNTVDVITGAVNADIVLKYSVLPSLLTSANTGMLAYPKYSPSGKQSGSACGGASHP